MQKLEIETTKDIDDNLVTKPSIIVKW
jgi:hypothetical protein